MEVFLMNDYDYNGYTITETPEGYYQVGEYEFVSYDEACDWIDSMQDEDIEDDMEQPALHTYILYYISDDRAYETPVDAHTPQEAKQILWRDYDADANILDCYAID